MLPILLIEDIDQASATANSPVLISLPAEDQRSHCQCRLVHHLLQQGLDLGVVGVIEQRRAAAAALALMAARFVTSGGLGVVALSVFS